MGGKSVYIAKIRVQNFRCFQDIEIEFNEGLNVIIGENNSGKTTIMKAIQYIFNNSHINNPTVDDLINQYQLNLNHHL